MKSRFRNLSFLLVLMVSVLAFAPAEPAPDIPDTQIEVVQDTELTETVQTLVVQAEADNPQTSFLYTSAPEPATNVDQNYLQAMELNYKQIEQLTYQEPYLTMDKWRYRSRLI